MTKYTTPMVTQNNMARKTDIQYSVEPLSNDSKHQPSNSPYSKGEKSSSINTGNQNKIAIKYRILMLTVMIIALIIVPLLILNIYITKYHQESAKIQLQNELDALNKVQQTQHQQYQDTLNYQEQLLNTIHAQQDAQGRKLEDLQNKLTAIMDTNANTWLLSHADFLVKMASRKLWGDHDVITASALLKSADANLAKMNDSSLILARRAIIEDINILAGINQIDFDGIILKLNQLTNQVDNLHLANNYNTKIFIDSNNSESLESLQNRQQSITKSWYDFIDKFITVRHRHTNTEPVLALNQDVYLRGNIQAYLLVAAQAISRYQNEIYHKSLDSVSTLVHTYFDTTNINTRSFLNQLDELNQENIAINLPDSLQSQSLLDSLIQTKVRNLLALPVISDTQGE